MDQRAAQAELLLHAAGQLAGRPLGEAGEAGALEQCGDPALALGAVLAEQAAEEVDILEDRKRRIEVLAQALRHVGDARAARRRRCAASAMSPPSTSTLPSWICARAGDQRRAGSTCRRRPARSARPCSPAGMSSVMRVERRGLAVGQAHRLEARRPVRGASFGSLTGSAARRPFGLRIELDIGHAGEAGLHLPDVFAAAAPADIRALTRNISFCRSSAVSTVLGVNCATSATNVALAGITYCGAASSTRRTSAADRRRARPARSAGRRSCRRRRGRPGSAPARRRRAPRRAGRRDTARGRRAATVSVLSLMSAVMLSMVALAASTAASASTTCAFAALIAASAAASCALGRVSRLAPWAAGPDRRRAPAAIPCWS